MTKITTTNPRLQIAGIYLSNVFMVFISFRVPHRDYGSLNRFENKKKRVKESKMKENKTKILLLYHFYFNSILIVHTSHANFDFN